MKSFFSKFNRIKPSKSILSDDVINLIHSHLYYQSNKINFKMKEIHGHISANLYSFPGSFNYDLARNSIKSNGFQSAYDIMIEVYKKIDISIVISEEDILNETEYSYIHIKFYSQPIPEISQRMKYVDQNFIILLCTSPAGGNTFRLLYSNYFFIDYVRDILGSECIDINNPKNDIQKAGFKDFEKVLQGICQYFEIELPDNINLPSQENLLEKDIKEPNNIEVTLVDFEDLIKLVSRGNIEEKLLKKKSKIFFKNLKKESNEDYEMFEENLDFFESMNTWNSDWKFDPEDAEYFISKMIGEDLNFEYPEGIYSDALFPYIQSALGKKGFELMTYDTHGDNYLFFVANKSDVARILELSELTKIEVDQL